MRARATTPRRYSMLTAWRLPTATSAVLIKALKPKGSSQTIKQGTKVKNIRLVPGADHNIDCKIEGFGGMMLKSEFVKKA